MRSTEPTVFLVWQFDTVIDGRIKDEATGTKALTYQQSTLRAVDTEYEQAKKHLKYLEKKQAEIVISRIIKDGFIKEPSFFRIESCSANHLFGSKGGLGTLERINKRKPL